MEVAPNKIGRGHHDLSRQCRSGLSAYPHQFLGRRDLVGNPLVQSAEFVDGKPVKLSGWAKPDRIELSATDMLADLREEYATIGFRTSCSDSQ
jgi:hypothetical protein